MNYTDESTPVVEQTNTMLADGGMMEEGGSVDPVSGNDVPTGSLKEEVRDDVDAKLSPGEFVLPADVVRYIGLEKLMKIRDAAKEGLARMEEVGQMGNAEEAPKTNESFAENDDEFNNSIDEIMSEVDNEDQTTKMATGGFITGAYQEGMKVNSAVDVRYFKHPDGRVIYITYINDRPMTAIPEGFTQTDTPVEKKIGKEAEDAAAAAAARANAGAGSGSGGDNPQPLSQQTIDFFDKETEAEKETRMIGVNNFLQELVNIAVPGAGLINAMPSILSSATLGSINNALSPLGPVNYGIPVEDQGTYASGAVEANNVNAGLTVSDDAEAAAREAGAGMGGGTSPSNSDYSYQGNDSMDFGGPPSGQTSADTGVGNPGESSANDSSGGGCFLTTAAVEHMGQKDDGEVLTTLREFRDGYMRRNKEGSKDIAWYYDNAPKIVRELDKHPDADKQYKRIYRDFILPAYRAIKENDMEYAYELYKDCIDFAKKASGIDREKLDPRYGGKAKGGFIAKKDKPVVAKSKKGLASR